MSNPRGKTSNTASNDNYNVQNRVGGAKLNRQKDSSMSSFVNFAMPRNYNIARQLGAEKAQALKIATYMTRQQGLESQYGRSNGAVNNNNRSGSMYNGKIIKFENADKNDSSIYKMFKNKFSDAVNATGLEDYINKLQNGTYRYEDSLNEGEYLNRIRGTKTLDKEIKNYLNSGATKDWTFTVPRRRRLESLGKLAV